MVDTKISALTAATAAAVANELPINEAGTSKKLTVQLLLDLIGVKKYGMTSDHAISSVTGTAVTQMGTVTLPAGNYRFEYYLLVQSATATVSPLLGVNFTGTATGAWWFEYADLSGTLLAAIGTMSGVGTTAVGFGMASGGRTFSTTSPNMGDSSGATNRVDAINANILVKISGVLVVTVSGDLVLWHSSQTATSTTVKAGSSLVVSRTA